MSKPDARSIVLSRRAKFVAAAIAATGIAIVHESHAVDGGAPAAVDAGTKAPTRDAARDAGPRVPLTKEKRAEQTALLHRMREAFEEKDYATALAAGRRAYTMEPLPFIAKEMGPILIALTDEQLKEGHLASALEALEYETTEGALHDDPPQAVMGRLDELLKRCPTIILEGAPGSRLRVDGMPRPIDNKPLRIDPGEHEVTGTNGPQSGSRKFTVREGQHDVRVNLYVEANPQPCLQPLRYDDEPHPPKTGCGCNVPGMK